MHFEFWERRLQAISQSLCHLAAADHGDPHSARRGVKAPAQRRERQRESAQRCTWQMEAAQHHTSAGRRSERAWTQRASARSLERAWNNASRGGEAQPAGKTGRDDDGRASAGGATPARTELIEENKSMLKGAEPEIPPCDISLPLLSGSRIARARLSAARQMRL